MFDFKREVNAPIDGKGEGLEHRAVLAVEGVIYTVGFGVDSVKNSSGYCVLVQDDKLNLLISHITGTIAGYNYSNVWSAY